VHVTQRLNDGSGEQYLGALHMRPKYRTRQRDEERGEGDKGMQEYNGDFTVLLTREIRRLWCFLPV
jgi:hypothetical protein